MDYYFEDNKVFANFTPDKRYGISEQVLNPAIAFGVLNEAMGWVPVYTLKHLTVLAECSIRVFAPVPLGKKLNVIAEAMCINHWVSEVQGTLTDDDGNIYYKTKGKYLLMHLDKVVAYGHVME